MNIPLSGLRLALVGALGYLVLLLPLGINGAPFYWPDSFAYLTGGGTALETVLGVETRYSARAEAAAAESGAGGSTTARAGTDDAAPAPAPAPALAPAPAPVEDRISKARSPYYAVFLAGFSAAFGPMAPVFVQAFAVLAAMGLLIRAVFGRITGLPALGMLAALLVSSAGLFSALLLPDILAPLGLLSVAVLFAFWQRLSRGEILLWYLLLLAAVLSHSTHLALTLLLVPFGLGLARLIHRPGAGPALLVLSAVGIGILGGMIFTKAVERSFGYTPQSFPMVAASIITDGTGRAYLEATCPESGFVYCAHLDNRATEVDQYLWSSDPALGVYKRADLATQAQLSDQQWRFLISTLRFDFWGQVRASSGRMWRQLCNNSLVQLGYVAEAEDLGAQVPEPDLSRIKTSAAMRGTFDFRAVGLASQWIGWLALAGVLALILAARNRPDTAGGMASRRALLIFTGLVCLGILINAGLTGAASQPQGRYGARLFWLLPVLLALWGSWVRGQKTPG